MAKSTVQYGSQGGDVLELQKYLNRNGYSLKEDGIFGNNTKNAVLKYQGANGLATDGIVGNITCSMISFLMVAESISALC